MKAIGRPFSIIVLLPLIVGAGLFSSCRTEGCLSQNEGCTLPPVCEGLVFECAEDEDELVELFLARDNSDIPGGQESAGSAGDFVLQNSQVVIVLDALDNPNYVSSTGGMILDAATRVQRNDSLNHIFHVTGALPGDSVVYTSVREIETGLGKALQYEGHLAEDERLRVYTRYELRPCEPGLRVRTEMINGSDDDRAWMNADGYWWGGRQNQAFAPAQGVGYVQPAFGLSTLNDAITVAPFMAASYVPDRGTAYATTGCVQRNIEMLNSDSVSLVGTTRRVVTPGDYVVYERMHVIGDGEGVQPATDSILEIRRQLFNEGYITVTGSVTGLGGISDVNRAQIHIDEGRLVEPAEMRTPLTTVVPDADGNFSVRVRANTDLVFRLVSFGREQNALELSGGDADVELEPLPLFGIGTLTSRVMIDGVQSSAQLFIYPAEDATWNDAEHRFNDIDEECPVLLGYPYGKSPACNRVLTTADDISFDLPEGDYVVFATAGPFVSLARAIVSVGATTEETITLELSTLDVLPPNTLSADFHVHGAASFDSSIPHLTRVQSFLSQRVDVIAATDHDAIFNYENALATLNVEPTDMILLTGLETTGFILNKYNPDVTFPQVVGHWNFWPLTYSPEKPRNGAPFDELAQPGEIFARVKQADLPEHGIIQLNHPWSDALFGRDLGWLKAIGLNLNNPLPKTNDGTGPGLYTNRPLGVEFRNSDYHAQEVMNGTESINLFAHRAVWFYLLQEGFVKAGTANSDSHSLLDNVVGTPRTLVKTQASKDENFDIRVFNGDVKDGHMTGTSGPVIDVVLRDGDETIAPSVHAHSLNPGATLDIVVTASPWVPVDEVRVLVNGEVKEVFPIAERLAADVFGTEGLERFRISLDVDALLENTTSDAFIIVEAGDPIPVMADLNCDGVPDTIDKNGDGVADWRDTDDEEQPEECEGSLGDFDRPEDRLDYTQDENAFSAVVVNRQSFAFTNPIVLDLNGNGFGGTR